jgi:predicted metalloprotease
VIAHEVGHHVQNLLGITAKVDSACAAASAKRNTTPERALELQADCYAGVWANPLAAGQARSWSRATSNRP